MNSQIFILVTLSGDLQSNFVFECYLVLYCYKRDQGSPEVDRNRLHKILEDNRKNNLHGNINTFSWV
jgi:hypothetical protein